MAGTKPLPLRIVIYILSLSLGKGNWHLRFKGRTFGNEVTKRLKVEFIFLFNWEAFFPCKQDVDCSEECNKFSRFNSDSISKFILCYKNIWHKRWHKCLEILQWVILKRSCVLMQWLMPSIWKQRTARCVL